MLRTERLKLIKVRRLTVATHEPAMNDPTTDECLQSKVYYAASCLAKSSRIYRRKRLAKGRRKGLVIVAQ